MTVSDNIYGKLLLELEISQEAVEEAEEILSVCPELCEMLSCPVVTLEQKRNIIKKLFPKEIVNFLCVICKNNMTDRLKYIFEEFYALKLQSNGVTKAIVRYVTELTPQQCEGMKNLVKKKYHAGDVILELHHEPDLIGGFILNVGDYIYDRSFKSNIRLLHNNLKGR